MTGWFTPLAAALGLALGGPYAWLVRRYVAGAPAWHLGPACPACGAGQGPGAALPLVASVLRRGRCRVCGARLGPAVPWLELGSALLAALLAWRLGPGLPFAIHMAFGGALLVAAGIDAEVCLLPDAVTLGGAALAPPAAVYGLGLTWGQSLGGALAGAGLFWAVRRGFFLAHGTEGMGLGDVKLAGLLGGLCGLAALPGITVIGAGAALAAGALGAALRPGNGAQGPQRIPFGPFLCLGALAHVLWGPELATLWGE